MSQRSFAITSKAHKCSKYIPMIPAGTEDRAKNGNVFVSRVKLGYACDCAREEVLSKMYSDALLFYVKN